MSAIFADFALISEMEFSRIEIAASILSAMRRLGPKNDLHDITPYGVISLLVEATSVSFKREGGFSDE